ATSVRARNSRGPVFRICPRRSRRISRKRNLVTSKAASKDEERSPVAEIVGHPVHLAGDQEVEVARRPEGRARLEDLGEGRPLKGMGGMPTVPKRPRSRPSSSRCTE